ncbi:MAG: hypothetical protein U9N13_08715 [Euryarchaeota archaeon]|nr:hypothetical protein [Euryarchaeota archaeon]
MGLSFATLSPAEKITRISHVKKLRMTPEETENREVKYPWWDFTKHITITHL